MAKRAKQVDLMVEEMNLYLRTNRIISELDKSCLLLSRMLCYAGCYRGFNWFYLNEYGVQVLVGSYDPEIIRSKDGYIQFY